VPDDLPPPSVEVLVALVVSLGEELRATRVELEQARTRIVEVQAFDLVRTFIAKHRNEAPSVAFKGSATGVEEGQP
jgi:hypothetical protein